MTNMVGKIRVACCAFALGMLAPMALGAQQGSPNTIEIVVGNGPFAGTYKQPSRGDEVLCMSLKQSPHEFAATWRDVTPTSKTVLAEAGVGISNPDAADAKRGHAAVTFGNPAKNPTRYEVNVPGSAGSGTLSMSRSGSRVDIVFVGRTKDGIQLRITAKCLDIDSM